MGSRIFAALLTAAALSGFGATSVQAYPPTPRVVTASPTFGEPSFDVTVTATCTPGESVTFSLLEAETVADCLRSSDDGESDVDEHLAGEATATIVAPATPGDHRGTVRGSSNSAFGSFTITVVDPAAVGSAGPIELELTSDLTPEWTWWPVLLAMGAVTTFMAYTLQRPLQLSPHR